MTHPLTFHTVARDPSSRARAGWFDTPHGRVLTPVFMPVGTQATVKSLLPDEVRRAGAQLVLANAYHLERQPGADVVAALGGLHTFMGWHAPILTDSGGFQLFSLGRNRPDRATSAHDRRPPRSQPLLERLDETGVVLRSHVDGTLLHVTPEHSMAVQRRLGADIIMAFDQCTGDDADEHAARDAMGRTHRWLLRCEAAWRHTPCSAAGQPQALFGIVQGGLHQQLRRESAAFVAAQPLAGFAVGGESIGFSKETTGRVLDWIGDLLPDGRPRYAMGVGEPDDFFAVVARGIDLFDCVLPTRMARNGTVFTPNGRLRLSAASTRRDGRPIDETCACATCRSFSRAALRHLFKAGEPLGPRLATVHNVTFCCQVVNRIRDALLTGTFSEFQRQFLDRYRRVPADHDAL